jgi:AhpD family alkylhydroperoxidase
MTTKETITGETAPNSPAVAVRLDFDAHAAGFARALASLDHAATKELDRVAFDPRLRELVRIRASQLNGCAYCIDMHTTDARAIGETEQRLYALTAWRDTPFFTDRRPRPGPGLRRGRRAVHRRRGRRAAGLDRDHQRLERHRREHACLATRQLQALTSSPRRLGEQDASGSTRQPPAHR